ncbi:MAG: hypothetical protein QOE60_1087, partial [Thermoleophilaceae bacterium]|nr:hypothetical protein [Thermoleophilaceae bacterium]
MGQVEGASDNYTEVASVYLVECRGGVTWSRR